MKTLNILLIIIACNFMACKKEHKKPQTTKTESSKTITLAPKKIDIALSAKNDSHVNGNVIFKESDGRVSMVANINGLTPGEHAIHIHASSDCSSPDGKSAGGHWNPTAQPHGKWGSKTGYHKGDIGNFIADKNGNGSISITTKEWCIGCEDKTKNILGKGIIIHAGTDDLTSQPSGAAGARVSCAGIIQ